MKNPGNQTPFRVGGRGSKQLSKALEQSSADRDLAWVFCTGSHACFAKVISFAMSGIMIQPMSPVEGDPNLYKPWEGHLWLEKRDQIHPVQMKQELGGWRVIFTASLREMVDSTLKHSRKSNLSPLDLSQPPLDTIQHCDLISLEEFEFETQSSTSNAPLLIEPLPTEKDSVIVTAAASSKNDLPTPDPSSSPEEDRTVINIVENDSHSGEHSSLDVSHHESELHAIEEKQDEGMMSPIPTGIHGSPAITLYEESPCSATLGECEPLSSPEANPWKSHKRSRRRAQDVPAISLGIAFDATESKPSSATSRQKRSSPQRKDKTKKTTRLPLRNQNQPKPVSPSTRRTLRQTSYRQRDDFFGSWPTRQQSAASGTWRL